MSFGRFIVLICCSWIAFGIAYLVYEFFSDSFYGPEAIVPLVMLVWIHLVFSAAIFLGYVCNRGPLSRHARRANNSLPE